MIMLHKILQAIHIPDDVLRQLENSLTEDQKSSHAEKKDRQETLERRLTAVRSRIDAPCCWKFQAKLSSN
jgi:hypothetical protein